jgi:hypothetical protein
VRSGHNYLLRAVPLDIWERAMKRASNEQRAIRGVLIRALEKYADSGIEWESGCSPRVWRRLTKVYTFHRLAEMRDRKRGEQDVESRPDSLSPSCGVMLIEDVARELRITVYQIRKLEARKAFPIPRLPKLDRRARYSAEAVRRFVAAGFAERLKHRQWVEWATGTNRSSRLGKPMHYHYADPAKWLIRAVLRVILSGVFVRTRGNIGKPAIFLMFRGAGYGDRTRLTGLGSQSITTMLSPLEPPLF